MNKKTLILSCLALLGLVSCGGQGGDDPTDSLTTDSEGNVVFDNVKLRVWSVIGDPDRAYLEMVNSSFNDLYADRGIQATITPIVNGDYYTQLANVINTDPDNAPDVIIFHSERLTKLAHDNIIVPMEEYFDLAKSPFVQQFHHSHRLLLPCLRKGILERGATVADSGAAHLLGTVEVSQGHIIEGIKEGGVHLVSAADRQFL